jgi:putative transposase
MIFVPLPCLADARRKLVLWLHDYNRHRPHSTLADGTPAEFAAACSGGNDGEETALESTSRLPHSPTASMTPPRPRWE